MSIATGTGDGGRTSLYCGARVDKDDIRMEACGALDEVASFLGMAKSCAANKKTGRVASRVQKDIIILNAELASSIPAVKRLKKRISGNSVLALEREIACLEGRCRVRAREFCLQGQNVTSSTLDIARAITRRAERICVTMTKKKLLDNKCIISYLNRLSDLLYLLARFNEKK